VKNKYVVLVIAILLSSILGCVHYYTREFIEESKSPIIDNYIIGPQVLVCRATYGHDPQYDTTYGIALIIYGVDSQGRWNSKAIPGNPVALMRKFPIDSCIIEFKGRTGRYVKNVESISKNEDIVRYNSITYGFGDIDIPQVVDTLVLRIPYTPLDSMNTPSTPKALEFIMTRYDKKWLGLWTGD
jgi:hypothetical protein